MAASAATRRCASRLHREGVARGNVCCRKLHNICNSVIILDEVQSIPVELLQPTLAAIREIAENYGCSIVLCTATQPALGKSDDFRIGLDHVTEIVPDPPHLFERLKRV